MDARDIVKDIMKEKNRTNADLANNLGISVAALWDRLSKTTTGTNKPKSITVKKLNDLLRCLDYELVIMPRGKAGRIEGAYVVTEDEEGDK